MLLDKPGPTDMSTKNTAVNDIAHVVVVIPAHDEAARLGRLLASMSLARRRVSEKVSTSCVVVADACTDRTAEVARCFLTGGQDVLCLLYTSYPADERSSVGLRGSRPLKKKKNIQAHT